MSDPLFSRGCLWPMWKHSSTPTHEYCGRERIPGQSYCAEHYARSIRASEEPAEIFVPQKFAA